MNSPNRIWAEALCFCHTSLTAETGKLFSTEFVLGDNILYSHDFSDKEKIDALESKGLNQVRRLVNTSRKAQEKKRVILATRTDLLIIILISKHLPNIPQI